MLIPDDVKVLCKHYEQYVPVIRDLVTEANAIIESQGLTELWIEEYSEPEPSMGNTPLKNGRVGVMVWAPVIKEFDQVLAFLRHKDIGLFRVPGESIGRVDGIRLSGPDFIVLRDLADILGKL